MNILTEKYNGVIQKIRSFNDEIAACEAKLAELNSHSYEETAERIAHLESVLEKIDDYLLRVRGFQEVAKKNLSSLNVLTVDAPPGYRVNLNRLRNWAMMIDPSSSDDPYAQRVYVTAKCDECFLLQKQEEFTATIRRLKTDNTEGLSRETEKYRAQADKIREERKGYAMSEEVSELARLTLKENGRFSIDSDPEQYTNAAAAPEYISPGAFFAPLGFDLAQREWLRNQFGRYLDPVSGRMMLPVELEGDREFVITVTCSPSRRKLLDSGIQNLLFHLIDKFPAGTQKIYLLDAVRYNTAALGSLKALEDTFAMAKTPRNPEQLAETVEGLLSSFSDVDDVLGLYDSVREYNRHAEKEKRLPFSTLVIYGWPNAYESRERELLQRIMTNYERYGVSVVAVTYANEEPKPSADRLPLPEYAYYNAIHVSMVSKEMTIAFPESEPQRFQWYGFEGQITHAYAASLKEKKTEKNRLGNEYTKRYSMTERPGYTREYRKIELPFGIDGKEQAHSLSFENENFAAYLVGASRSGKSTLIHTLIAGLIRNYHPDNLELWLADFKQLEFKRYIRHLPPHVRYVLLDESTELVYDLIDRLTQEMMERQKLFSRLGKQRIDQVDVTKLAKPLPVIFVILDEFSIMSQSIAESQIYKLRLQNILAKGAALGIRFLFSSQTFTTGVSGLTATARAQIQQRISMKGSKEEISETLELSQSLKTDQVRNWMDALPPHYALVKYRTDADTVPQVKRFLVMYFEDYARRDAMIDDINRSMHAIEGYDATDIASYSDKHPVLVDGSSFDAFDRDALSRSVAGVKSSGTADLSGEEIFLSFGTPRLMTRVKLATLTSETRENLLLIGGPSEQACCASVLLSAAGMFAMQGGRVEIWAYEKNRLLREYKDRFVQQGVALYEGMDAVCDRIRAYRDDIRARVYENTLILLVGMDRICMDFDYVDGAAAPGKSGPSGKKDSSVGELRRQFEQSGAVVQTETDEKMQKIASGWTSQRIRLKKQYKSEGRSAEEIKELLAADYEKYMQEKTQEIRQINAEQSAQPQTDAPAVPGGTENAASQDAAKSGAYRATEDFNYIVKQGSRLGRHFMLHLTSFADFKATGLKLDDFRHRMAFQIPADDSRELFVNKSASSLPEHICQYYDLIDRYSFRPYLHSGIGWEGWSVEPDGRVNSPYAETGD